MVDIGPNLQRFLEIILGVWLFGVGVVMILVILFFVFILRGLR